MWLWTLAIHLVLVHATFSKSEINQVRKAGENAFAKHDLKMAGMEYSKLIQMEPNNERNYYKRYRVYLSDRKYAKALQDLTEALKILPTYKQALSQRGKVHLMLGQCKEAKMDYEALLKLDMEFKGLKEALPKAEHCVQLLDQAEKQQSAGDYQGAYDAISHIVEHYASSSVQMYMERAQLGVSLGNTFDAIADSGHALKLDANSVFALQFRGQLFYSLGDMISLETAVKHYRMALHSDPEHKAIKKEFRRVKNLIKKLKNIDTDMESNQHRAAVKSITDTMSMDHDNAEVTKTLWNKLCECHAILKLGKEGKASCVTALSLDEENAMNHARLGQSLLLLEEFEEAVREYSQAHELDKNNQEIHQGLQRAQVALKQSKEKNYYKILGVARNAEVKIIKKAYRKKALEFHPDKHADGTPEEQEKARTQFHDIAEAYEILSDTNLRGKYDRGEDVLNNNSGQQRRHNPFQGHGGQRFHFNFG